MRIWLPVLLATCAAPALAQAAPRVAIEDTGATVEHPGGWTLMPASGSPPVVMFNLCDPQVSDGCQLKGEMAMKAPDPGMETSPLQQYIVDAAKGDGSPPKPRLVKSGDRDALETRWSNPQSPVRHASSGAQMLIDTPQGRFVCSLMMEPDHIESMLGAWRRFCTSLETEHTTDMPAHG